MRTLVIEDRSRRSWADPVSARPLRLTVWEPTNGEGAAPLTLLSHGTGGQVAQLGWLAQALVAAGYAVVGVDHHGNTSAEPYLPEGFACPWERPRDVSLALDWALASLEVDVTRVSVAGFSLGGYTAAALAGARLDPGVVEAVLSGEAPLPPLPEMPDLLARLASRHDGDALAALVAASAADVADARVSRAVMLAPSIGALVDDASLGEIRMPALVLWGDADAEAEPGENARRYLASMPHAEGWSMGRAVAHYDWIAEGEAGDNLRRNA
ncbi:MAG: alpha/beta hydrolase family protein, partial [Demequina sp.]|uniref:alpha/beta hydrolase family protein n=1 Tax=Demequina sp. TaxID=2050685 RepID=UPI003A8BC891